MCSTCGCRAAEDIDPIESYIVPAPMGRGVAQYYAEGGETATYAPSQDPEGSTPATEPTNANFSADVDYDAKIRLNNPKDAKYITPSIIDGMDFEDDEGVMSSNYTVMDAEFGAESEKEELERLRRIVANLPDSICRCCGDSKWTMDGIDFMCVFCEEMKECDFCNEDSYYGAESKSMFGKDRNGRMYARRRNGQIITHNAEHEGVYACSKCKHWNRNPVDGITKCKKCGNGNFTFVKRSEFMPDGDGNVVGQQTFSFNGTPLHAEEDTSFGLVGEGNDFGQMRAEDFEADFSIEKPFQTGVKLSAGLLTGAALFGLAGATLTALIGSMMDKGE
jgi:hypothetical protein